MKIRSANRKVIADKRAYTYTHIVHTLPYIHTGPTEKTVPFLSRLKMKWPTEAQEAKAETGWVPMWVVRGTVAIETEMCVKNLGLEYLLK